MSEKKNFSQDNKKRFGKIILFFILSLLFLLAGVGIVLQIPAVQTKLVKELASYLSEKIEFPVDLKKIEISWFDEITLQDLTVLDQQDSTMIAIKELRLDFNITSLLARDPLIDEVILKQPKVQLIKNTPDSGLNINRFIKNIRALIPEKRKSDQRTPVFTIKDVSIENGQFLYHDPYKDTIDYTFDYNHFVLENINADIDDLKIVADTFEINVRKLNAYAPAYAFNIDNVETLYRYSSTAMEFLKLDLKAGNSTLRDSVVFSYRDPATLEYFVDSVNIHANLDNSIIHTKELAVFAPYLKRYEDTYELSGQFDGTIRKFDASKLTIKFGKSSYFRGFLSMDGLPNFSETFIDLEVKSGFLKPSDLRQYTGSGDFYNKLEKLGGTSFKGQFLGFPNDFVANGKFDTQLGFIGSDINLKLHDENQDLSTYSGGLTLKNFQLGKLINEQAVIQNVSMSGNVKGQGFTLETAFMDLKAKFEHLGIYNYDYKNISTNGRLAKQFFSGKISVNDPNIQVNGEGSIDLRDNKNQINFRASIDTAFLKPLRLTDQEVFLRTNFDFDITGLELDKLTGKAFLSDTYLVVNSRDLLVDTLSLYSIIDSTGRKLHINTDRVELKVEGDFDYTRLTEDVKRLYEEYRLNFDNDAEEIEAYYASKQNKGTEDFDRYSLQFNANLKNINPLVRLFVPELYISENTLLEGSFTGGYTSIISLNTQIDTILYKENYAQNVVFDLNSSKIADSTNVLAMLFVSSDKQNITKAAPTEDLFVEAIWDRDHIDLTASVHQQESDNRINVNSDIYFNRNQTALSFNTSELKLFDKIWKFSEGNQILFQNDEVVFKDFRIFNQDQFLLAEGTLSNDRNKSMRVNLHDLELNLFNPLLQQNIDGTANGTLVIENAFKAPYLEGEVKIDSFFVDNFLVGNIFISTNWDNPNQRLKLEVNAERKGNEILFAKGYYDPFQEDNQLNVEAKLKNTNLNILEPFFDEYFSNIKGTVSGNLLITGSPTYPILKGGGRVYNGHMKINYLNTNYTFEGEVVFTENEIGFRQLEILDTDKNKAFLNGGIFHDGFKNFVIDIRANLNKTKVLNTTPQDNSLYYGIAYASGDLEILGPVNNLQITARAISEKGTKIFIPLEDSNTLEKKDFINFVSRNDTIDLEESIDKKINLSGIKLNFDLEITPDAYTEIIFDLKAGDIIRGRGNGKLELEIDTEGNFNMFGTYEIVKGAYNFTLFNVITKEFIIEPGGQIKWTGDPYGAIMNIQASYKTKAALTPILLGEYSTTADNSRPEVRRPYPVTLNMTLTGDLMSPDIDFDINIDEYPPILYSDIQRFENRLQTDEQYLKRQVFNLIVLRQFSKETNALGFGSQTAISSISELLSNQFSTLATQIDENLEIDVDFTSSVDEDAINTFQLRLSYTFLNGRLRITRDGSIVTTPDQQQDVNNLIGDWTIEYLLTKDGQYKVKMYSRNTLNQINSNFSVLSSFKQGVSITQTKSFDSFKELFERAKKKQNNNPPARIQDNNDEGLIREEEELNSSVNN